MDISGLPWVVAPCPPGIRPAVLRIEPTDPGVHPSFP